VLSKKERGKEIKKSKLKKRRKEGGRVGDE